MGIFDFLTAEKKEEKLMQDKTSRAVAIVVSYTVADEDAADSTFGKVVFKMKKDQVWEQFEVVLRENVGAMVPGDQWIVKLDEGFTRIVAPLRKLTRGSQYRIYDED